MASIIQRIYNFRKSIDEVTFIEYNVDIQIRYLLDIPTNILQHGGFTMKRKKEPEKNNKKLITFKNLEFINGIIQDFASMEDKTFSAVVEDILLREILPNEEAPKYYIQKIYKDGLKETFISLMQNLSAGLNFDASEDNAYELVNLGMKIVSSPFNVEIDSAYKDLLNGHFKKNCNEVKLKLEHEKNENPLTFDEKRRLKDDIALLEYREPFSFVAYNYFELVLSNWAVLGNYSYTFRLLFDVVALSDPELWNSAEYRLNAVECIKKVTATWKMY